MGTDDGWRSGQRWFNTNLAKETTKLARPVAAYLRESLDHTFAGYFAATFLNLMLKVGVDRIIFSADYPLWVDGGGSCLSQPNSRYRGRPKEHPRTATPSVISTCGWLSILVSGL
jgi:hypothetical protein